MKRFSLFVLVLAISSCQRYHTFTTPEGIDVHLQGDYLTVLDAEDNFQQYYLPGAYTSYNQSQNLSQLLASVESWQATLGMIHVQSTRAYIRKYNRLFKKGRVLRSPVAH